ncbi:hypothetical protein BAUCODRAFT_472464 [Baudoinia panamericana UAMH 10762]|uniref:Ketoreductase domain-containing protein n=1 Tax=Baudoinia panamericana (strain UAMH 10762) TaxID=717646 RepID=M2LPN2_BAUPA|nr:uncharacterized protein BAUCODRAFT_472464 [Baudoinia panamericana UAMH 10762]EMC96362.1 hypothetical protein BAUCODRAFT_472464 [Baudoinia panamericana UAMH 10762]
MEPDKVIVLITGANTGIGFELAAQLAAKGTYFVYLTARSVEEGQAAWERLRSWNYPGGSAFIQLDVTSDDSIHAAAAAVEQQTGRLDILVNNAAIGRKSPENLREQMQACFDANATGPLILGDAFADLLKKSTHPLRRIVNVSSGAGSIGRMIDTTRQRPTHYGRTVAYSASKAAFNMVAAVHKNEFASSGVKVLVYNPGFTVSELGEFNTVANGAMPVDASVKLLVDVVEGGRDSEENLFLSGATGTYPW